MTAAAFLRSPPVVRRWAEFCPDFRYRYELGREWDPDRPGVAFAGVNPSTADSKADDPTCLRAWHDFAEPWGFGRLHFINPFARVSSSPAELLTARDPEGPDNAAHVARVLGGVARVVVCWGNAEILRRRPEAVARMLQAIAAAGHVPLCLGTNDDGSPRHPLARGRHRVPSGFQPVAWGGAR